MTLIALIGLSFAFDKLSLGKIFTVEKKIKKVEENQVELTEENIRLNQENSRFKQEMLTLMLNSMNQLSNQLSNQTVNINTGANVLPASKKDEESVEQDYQEENGEELPDTSGNEEPNKGSQAKGDETENIPAFKPESGRNQKESSYTMHASASREIVEQQAIKLSVENLGLPFKDISHDVKKIFPINSR